MMDPCPGRPISVDRPAAVSARNRAVNATTAYASRSTVANSNGAGGGPRSSTGRTWCAAVTACSPPSNRNGMQKVSDRTPTVRSSSSVHVARRRVRPGAGCGQRPTSRRSENAPAICSTAEQRVRERVGGFVEFLGESRRMGLRAANDAAVITTPPSKASRHDMWWPPAGIDRRRHQMWWLGPASGPLPSRAGNGPNEQQRTRTTLRTPRPGRTFRRTTRAPTTTDEFIR